MIEVRNLTKSRVSVKKVKALAKSILKREKSRGGLSVVLVSSQRMRELNKKYRKKDSATNVLAFPGGKEALGEAVLCPSVIKKNALEYKMSFNKALAWIFVHGLLHLLGYEHKTKKGEREMNRKEQRYLSLFL